MKLKQLAALFYFLLVFSNSAFAAIEKYQDVVQMPSGQGVNTPTITVYTAGSTTIKATLYSGISGSAIANPITGDTYGRYSFFADEGYYDLSISKTGYSTQVKYRVHVGPAQSSVTTLQTNVTTLQTNVASLQTSNNGIAISDARCGGNIATCDALTTSLGVPLVCTSSFTISSAVTVTSPMEFKKGCLISCGSYTITHTGPVTPVDFQVYNCSAGQVVGLSTATPEMFGNSLDKAFSASYHVITKESTTYLIDNDTIYLDSSDRNHTYILEGSGHGSIISLANYTTGYAFKLNENSSGTKVLDFVGHPRLIVKNVLIDGAASTQASFLWYNEASFSFENVKWSNVFYGAYGTGYVDQVRFDGIDWRNPKKDGWIYRQGGNGDSFYGNQIYVFSSDTSTTGMANAIWLKKSDGATLSSINGGSYKIENSFGVNITGGKFENNGDKPITIIGSQVTVADSTFWNHLSNYPITIDDSNTTDLDRSNVVLEHNKFNTFQTASTTERGYDVYLKSPKPYTKVVFKDNSATFNVSGTWIHNQLGIKVGSDDSALQTELDLKQPYLSSDVEIKSYNSAWEVTPLGMGNRFIVPVPVIPFFNSAFQTQTAFGSIPTGTTYYYNAQVYTLIGKTNLSTEQTITTTLNDVAIRLDIQGYLPNSMLRLWRGVSSGSYDRYVDLPLSTSWLYQVFDSGTHVLGYPWITTSLPAATGGLAYGGLYDNGHKTVFSSVSMSLGTWSTGDRTTDEFSSTGGAIHRFVCTAGGTPGTWIDEHLINKECYPFARSFVQSNLTGTTGETTLATLPTITAGSMGPNGYISLYSLASYTSSTNTKVFNWKVNGTTAMTNSVSISGVTQKEFHGRINNRNDSSSQINEINGLSNNGGVSEAHSATAINTTAAMIITITGTLGNATEGMSLEGYAAEICYGP